MEKTTVDDDKREEDDHNARTIRPSRSPSGIGRTTPLPIAKPPSPGLPPVVEDYSDLGFDEDDDKLQEKVADFKVTNFPSDVSLKNVCSPFLADEELLPQRPLPPR